MRVILVSESQELFELCRTSLRLLSIDGPILEAPGAKHGIADLTIRDLTAGLAAEHASDLKPHDLYIVSRESLNEIQEVLPENAYGLILNPVHPPVLRAFLSAALNRWSAAEGQATGAAKSPGQNELLQALMEANLRLQECDQDRTNFLARALHDFRTPLTALQGYCDMLLRQSAGPLDPDQIDLLKRMQHSIGRLSKMSRSLFELSVRRTIERKPVLARTSIATCMQNALHQIAPIAEDRGINLSTDVEPPDTTLYVDPAAIEQVLVNLLENACKFTPQNGSIEIRGRLATMECSMPTAAGAVELRVVPAYRVELRDTGMGILPDHLDSVFEEYTSYAGARDRSGGGLGLAICKMLITEHRGTIWAESDRQGTTVSFLLPMHHEMLGLPPTGSVERVMVAEAN